MVNIDRLVEVVPHYIAMLLVIVFVLSVVRIAAGNLGFWLELLIVLVFAAYPPMVRRPSVAPRRWERSDSAR